MGLKKKMFYRNCKPLADTSFSKKLKKKFTSIRVKHQLVLPDAVNAKTFVMRHQTSRRLQQL
ncbi:60S ribosomal protein L35 [Caenorhabditis elegans]|uniref:60S ribosomal protein L35 n=1 Tax=Caenorhabditis elegans TaxID=6239 RepID=A0A2K5ATQ9_CAEEL|nr:60S ribosomal protein L35 [Caenorhabditis elegans]SPC47295.1 60S ribosomal protein L35 [Caenorhabditis elegans]|eukprot:NP_001348708.1 Uncharacterized protein CELE_F28A10.13 [Caenorhabditis elegans]